MIINTIEEFCTHLKLGASLLAIDYGKKKVGIAISTPDHAVSLPLKIIKEESEKKKINAIIEIIKERKVCALIMGLPLNMDGTKSEQSLAVEEFANKLIGRIDLPMFFQDERLSSKAADSFLKSFGMKRKERNQKDDLTASSMILETVLMRIKPGM